MRSLLIHLFALLVIPGGSGLLFYLCVFDLIEVMF